MDDAFFEFQVLYVDVEFSSGCQYDYLRVSIYFVKTLTQYASLCIDVKADNFQKDKVVVFVLILLPQIVGTRSYMLYNRNLENMYAPV